MLLVAGEFDLFEAEEAALATALRVHADAHAEAPAYRLALGELIVRYQRLMRETRRMIRHGDRQERELNILNTRLTQLAEQLDYKARHDPLTGELNRGAVIDLATKYLQGGSLALIVLDIDHFKRINDLFGHPAGDAVIIELVQRLRTQLPSPGDLGRVGGEEFTVLLPGSELEAAVAVAQKMRQAISSRLFRSVIDRHVTASFGVSWSAAGTSFDQAYARADEALYVAKRSGRDQVAITDPGKPAEDSTSTSVPANAG